jgi:hypothetical protein
MEKRKELGKWHILDHLGTIGYCSIAALLPWSITLHLGKKWQLALVTSLERTQSLLSNRQPKLNGEKTRT